MCPTLRLSGGFGYPERPYNRYLQPQHVTTTSSVSVLPCILTPPIVIPLPVDVSWEAADADSGAWTPATRETRRSKWSSGLLAISDIWVVNEWMEGSSSLSSSPPLPFSPLPLPSLPFPLSPFCSPLPPLLHSSLPLPSPRYLSSR